MKSIMIVPNSRWYDLPYMWQYSCYFTSIKNGPVGVGSSLISSRIAIARSFYELVERFSLRYPSGKLFKLRFIEINDDKVLPYSLLLDGKNIEENKKFNPKLIKNTASPDDELYFTWGYDFLKNKKVLIPAQLIYVPSKRFTEKIIRESNSSGAAAGDNLIHCLVKAILELLERDAFVNYYLNEFWGERIEITKFPIIKSLIQKFKKYRLEVYSFHLPSDIKVFNIVTFIIDKSGLAPIINCGSSSGFDIESCILKSIEESLQVLMWIRATLLKQNNKIDLDSLEGRGLFWVDKTKLKLIYKWVNKSRKSLQYIQLIHKFKKLKKNRNSQLGYLISQIKNRNYNIYYSEITHKKFKKQGLKVIKVIIPQLQWIYLGESFKYILLDRIIKIRKINKLEPINVTIDRLNNVPHFFL